MGLFPFFYVCITNNDKVAECVDEARFVEGNAISVLIMARDMVHQGWKLVASPLYGNFKPNQQPYRTIVLSREKNDIRDTVDVYSLQLMETAMKIYGECEIKRMPGDMPGQIDRDYKYVDFALMKETLGKCGILNRHLQTCIRG